MANLSDTFTDTAGTGLASHTADSGHTWTEHASLTTGDMVISDANRVRSNSNNTSVYHSSWVPATADYDVTAVIRRLSSLGSLGVVARCETGANTMYLFRYNTGTTAWEILLLNAGASSTLGSFSQSLSDNTSYTLKAELRGTALKLYVDSVERISVTDSTISAKGVAGVRALTTVANTTGYHMDSIATADAVTATAARRMLMGC